MVSVQLHDSVAAALASQARLQGIALEEYLASLVKGSVAFVAPRLSAEKLQRSLNELPQDVSPMPANIFRAGFYFSQS